MNQPKRMSRKDFDKMLAIRKQNQLSNQRQVIKELREKDNRRNCT